MNYKIIPLNVGNFVAMPKQTCTYRMYREVTYEAPCVIWYIKGTRNNIIVDLGPTDLNHCVQNHGFAVTRTERQEPINALKSIGIFADDVNMVVCTHLHWDHVGSFHLFKNAKFLVQRKEIQYAIAPLPCHRSLFYETNIGKPTFADYLDQIQIVDGDYGIEDGVDLVSVPGHTPGSQGLLVRTEKGKYFIAGDTVGLFECWETIPHIPSTIFDNLDDYYASMEKIEKIADYVLPGHDPDVFKKRSYP